MMKTYNSSSDPDLKIERKNKTVKHCGTSECMLVNNDRIFRMNCHTDSWLVKDKM